MIHLNFDKKQRYRGPPPSWSRRGHSQTCTQKVVLLVTSSHFFNPLAYHHNCSSNSGKTSPKLAQSLDVKMTFPFFTKMVTFFGGKLTCGFRSLTMFPWKHKMNWETVVFWTNWCNNRLKFLVHATYQKMVCSPSTFDSHHLKRCFFPFMLIPCFGRTKWQKSFVFQPTKSCSKKIFAEISYFCVSPFMTKY